VSGKLIGHVHTEGDDFLSLGWRLRQRVLLAVLAVVVPPAETEMDGDLERDKSGFRRSLAATRSYYVYGFLCL